MAQPHFPIHCSGSLDGRFSKHAFCKSLSRSLSSDSSFLSFYISHVASQEKQSLVGGFNPFEKY